MTGEERFKEILKEVEESTNFEILAEMKAIMNKVFGEENNQLVKPSFDTAVEIMKQYGFSHRPNETFSSVVVADALRRYPEIKYYQIIIRFPKLEITDGSKKHTITDLFVRIYVEPSGRLFGHLTGVRTSVTKKEFTAAYLHSHLPALDSQHIKFQNFCTGIGPINQVISLLSSKFTTENFFMFTMHLKNYVAWESKEGGPYMYISDIPYRNSNTHSTFVVNISNRIIPIVERLLDILKTLEPEEIFDKLSFNMTERGITIMKTEKIEQWLASHIETQIPLMYSDSWNHPQYYLRRKDSTGNYHAIPMSDNVTYSYQTSPILTFKGEKISFKIIDHQYEEKQEKSGALYPHPDITKAFCEKLSGELSICALVVSGNGEKAPTESDKRSSKSDQIFMS